MRFSARNRVRTALCRALLAAWLAIPATAPAGPLLFGYPAREHTANPKLFPKWEGVLERTREAGADGPPCNRGNATACHFQNLRAIAAKARNLPEEQQINLVHEFVNRLTYITDIDLYGVDDYWATQFQFYAHDGGDCEDYAISKFFALKLLGYDPERMRVVIVHDTNLDADHAVLVVERDGKQWVLDNNLKRVVDSARLYHLLPYFALNETHWWGFLGVPKFNN